MIELTFIDVTSLDYQSTFISVLILRNEYLSSQYNWHDIILKKSKTVVWTVQNVVVFCSQAWYLVCT